MNTKTLFSGAAPLTYSNPYKPQPSQIASSRLLWTAHTHYLGYNNLLYLNSSPFDYTQEQLSVKQTTNVLHMSLNKQGILEIPYSALIFTLLLGRQIFLLTQVMSCSEAGD